MNSLLKISGIIILIIGFGLTIKPDLFSKFPTPIEGYQLIEKRVKWGILIGIGLFLMFYNDGSSWGFMVTGLFIALTVGIIVARLIGFVSDGFFTKQLWWLLIEVAALLLFGLLYFKQKSINF